MDTYKKFTKKYWYRPATSMITIDEAMDQAEEFDTLDELKQYLIDRDKEIFGRPLFGKDDLKLSVITSSDNRIGWENQYLLLHSRKEGDFPIGYVNVNNFCFIVKQNDSNPYIVRTEEDAQKLCAILNDQYDGQKLDTNVLSGIDIDLCFNKFIMKFKVLKSKKILAFQPEFKYVTEKKLLMVYESNEEDNTYYFECCVCYGTDNESAMEAIKNMFEYEIRRYNPWKNHEILFDF